MTVPWSLGVEKGLPCHSVSDPGYTEMAVTEIQGNVGASLLLGNVKSYKERRRDYRRSCFCPRELRVSVPSR